MHEVFAHFPEPFVFHAGRDPVRGFDLDRFSYDVKTAEKSLQSFKTSFRNPCFYSKYSLSLGKASIMLD